MFEWTLMKRLIWIKAAVISGAASLYETVTGAIVSFVALHAKALKKLVVNIEPVQDLHGYDAPWPPGGGVNKLPPVPEETKTSGDLTIKADGNGIFTISGTASAGSVNANFTPIAQYTVQNGDYLHLFNSAASASAVFRIDFTDGTYRDPSMTPENRILDLSSYAGKTIASIRVYIASGVSFDGTVKPMICQSSTAVDWSPYANECPISGWTGVKNWATGVNVWDEEWEEGSIDGATGQNESASGFWRTKNYIPIKPDNTYYVACSVTGALRGRFYDKDKNYLGTSDKEGVDLATNRTFIAPSDAYFVRFAPNNNTITTKEVSVNYPDTDHDYHAYSGQEIDVAFPAEAGTVYGGTDEVIGGNLKKTLKGVDLSTLAWSLTSSTYGRWTASISDIKSPTDGATPLNGLAENYRIVTSNAYNNIVGTMYCVPNGTTVNICNGSTTDTPSGTLVYEAAEPQQFTHEGHEISTQVGTNTIWADAGDVEVTYYAK